MSSQAIPEGFTPFPLDNSFNDVFAPMYLSISESGLVLGLRVEKHHLNPLGIVHGAVYMAMLDIAFSSQVGHSLGKFVGTPTININIDFMASSGEGEWLYCDVDCLKLSNTMGFTQGVVRSEEEIKVSGTGIFKLPRDLGAADGITLEQLMAIQQ